MNSIKPIAVLSAICLIVCTLLIVTYNLTYVDTSGVITEDLKAACLKIDSDGDFALITDREASGLSDKKFSDVVKIVKNKADGTFLFEVLTDGYASDGIDVVIGFTENGAVKGVEIVALGETPGVGTKINSDNFLGLFKGVSTPVTIVQGSASDNEIVGITGSTRSSKGLAKAVNLAISAYGALDKNAPTADTEGSNE